jgi:transcriptional regulator with XRE-family HTH domain
VKGYGERIKQYRSLKRYTQEELGKKVGVTKSFISKLESESTKPSLEMLLEIANALEVDIGDLVANKFHPPNGLKEVGVEWIVLGEELEKEGITPEQVKKWVEIVRNISQINDGKT